MFSRETRPGFEGRGFEHGKFDAPSGAPLLDHGFPSIPPHKAARLEVPRGEWPARNSPGELCGGTPLVG
jgi:hypothetical protein